MESLSSVLLSWYADHGRDLPWRQTRDPYRVWVSEIILQQTRVAQGYDYYQRFVERFPTVEDLASASSDEVMQQWEGLGYYSRARNLHAAAKQVMELGGFPVDYEGIRSLKGVGDYTAAAIASFVYGLPTAVVDGNVYRVLSRYYGIDTPIDTTAGKKTFAVLAQEVLDQKQPALHNQAIMDFGAIQCTPKSPDCSACPLLDSCAAYNGKRVDLLPVKSKKTAVKERFFTYIIILEESSVFLHRRSSGDIWTGLYEPLLFESSAKLSLDDAFAKISAYGNQTKYLKLLASVEGLKHQLTHRTLYADAYVLECDGAGDDSLLKLLPDDYIKVPLSELSKYASPRLVNIIFERTII